MVLFGVALSVMDLSESTVMLSSSMDLPGSVSFILSLVPVMVVLWIVSSPGNVSFTLFPILLLIFVGVSY